MAHHSFEYVNEVHNELVLCLRDSHYRDSLVIAHPGTKPKSVIRMATAGAATLWIM
jgi:hypothetical protein